MISLPPLLEMFPLDTFPQQEIGTGFYVQRLNGPKADETAVVAGDMLDECRSIARSRGSSDGVIDAEPFHVDDLPPVKAAAEGGVLILRNEMLFPGMVGVVLAQKGTLWVREDGTLNSSGFFRKQIPK
ncbi:unnamed protein product [Choristocarpus tenellus]